MASPLVTLARALLAAAAEYDASSPLLDAYAEGSTEHETAEAAIAAAEAAASAAFAAFLSTLT